MLKGMCYSHYMNGKPTMQTFNLEHFEVNIAGAPLPKLGLHMTLGYEWPNFE